MTKVDIHGELCSETHALYARKNADYGDSFAQLRKRYPNFVCMRLFDKLNRLDTIMRNIERYDGTGARQEDVPQ